MQPSASCSPNLEDSNSHLKIPRLPHESLHHLSSPSRELRRQASSSSQAMSSTTDDGSLADSVSSVGPDGWEAVDRLVPGDDDSDYPEEAISRVATPVIDELQQSALLTPPEPLDDAASNDDCEEEDVQTPLAKLQPDVSLLLESSQITFPENLDAAAAGREQDVIYPLAAIGGKTAWSYLEDSSWSDLENVAGSLKMKLAPRPLSLTGPLRLFYVGSPDFQDEIEAKIGSALVAGQGDNIPHRRRRSIMPISLSKESPQVELVPDSGANMEIETCVDVRHFPDGKETMKVTMDSGAVLTSSFDPARKKYAMHKPDWVPDLAIIQIPEDEEQAKSLRFRARQFLNRHAIPTIIITSDRTWQVPSRPLTVDTRSPHFVVHLPGTSMSESAVLRRLPVDVDTFLLLNSLQLNRALTSMLTDASSHSTRLGAVDRQKSQVGKSFLRTIMLLPLIVAFISFLFAMNPFAATLWQHEGTMLQPVDDAITAVTTSTLTAVASTISTTTRPLTSKTNSLSTISEKALSQVPQSSVQPNRSEKFEAETLGDNMILIKPPQWFLAKKRAPKITTVVSRKEEEIEHEVDDLSETKMFVVKIPWEEAHGELSVRILSTSRGAAVNQTLSVDFGTSAYWKAYWKMLYPQATVKKTAQQDSQQPEDVSKDSDPTHLPKDRLAEDVRALGGELKKLGQTLGQTVRSGLVSLHNERRRMREWKRQSRQTMMQDMASRIQSWAHNVQEYRRTHYREEQKNLLKLWWKYSGGPSEGFGKKVGQKHKCKSRSCGR